MSAIRPLATIAILAAVGIFLATKINQRPVVSMAEQSAWDEAGGLEEAPAFAPTATTGSTIEPRTAPGALTAAPAAVSSQPAPSKAQPPALPPLPELPEIKSSAPAPGPSLSPATPPVAPITKPLEMASAATPTASTPPPIAPPAGSPLAPPIDATATKLAPPTVSGRVPSLGSSTPDLAPQATTSIAPAAAPAMSSYAAARATIQAALDKNDLATAHQQLTQWYGDPTLTADERREVDQLLSQLAGTVIYSTEHTLEPAYTVRPGDTLETIATQHQVPWQLLAKINGVPRADAVQPGQQLKVIRGPFSAVVDVSDKSLVLLVGGRYAGRFAATIEGAAAGESEWRVAEKLTEPVGGPYAGYDPSLSTAMAHRMVLRSTAPGGATIEIAPQATATAATYSQHQGRIAVASTDAEDLFDILSVGSNVIVRR